MIKSKCSASRKESNIKLSDKRSQSATFANPENDEYFAVRADGCLIVGSKACDWILIKPETGLLAIELKGCNVDDAVEQIEATLQWLREAGESHGKLGGLVISTRVPAGDTKIQRLMQRVKRNFGANIKVKNDGRNLRFADIIKAG